MENIKEQWEKYQLKEKALKYYQENKVPEKMEKVLNLMFQENPVDVYGYISNYFETYAKPITIHKLQAYAAWDSKGQPTLGIDIQCTINNKKKLVTSMIFAGSDSQIWDIYNTKQLLEEKERELKSVKIAVAYINGSLREKFYGREIINSQTKTDAIIKGFFDVFETAAKEEENKKQEAIVAEAASLNVESVPTEANGTEAERNSTSKRSPGKKSAKGGKTKVDVTLPPNDPPYEWILGSPAGSALSQAMCATEAKVRDVLPFEHIASLASGNNQAPPSYRMPLLMVTMLHCGKLSAGKVNAFNEVMLIPSFRFSIKECISHLLCIQDHLISIFLESNPKLMNCINKVSDIGSITVQFDKPEQVLDLILEAIEAANFKPGTDFSIAINCAPHQLVDVEKGRYEFVNGATPKSLEDTAEFWVDLVKTYPSIVALIDPLRRKEGQLWLHLCELISNHCLIIGDYNDLWPEKRVSECKEMKATGHQESNCSPQSYPTSQQTEEQIADQVDTYVTSGHIFRMQHHTTVTDFIKSVAHVTGRVDTIKPPVPGVVKDETSPVDCILFTIEMGQASYSEAGTYAIPSVCQGEGRETFIADLAVGLRSRFLKTGGLSRGERFQVLNRLIYIEQLLTDAGKLEKDTVHWTFPKIETEKSYHPSESLEQT